MTDDEVLAVVNARALTYLQIPTYGEAMLQRNGWHQTTLDRVRQHTLFENMKSEAADQNFHRAQLVEAAKLLPHEWMASAAGIGTADDCAMKLQEYFDVGVNEICLHGASPVQNATVVDACRRQGIIAS